MKRGRKPDLQVVQDMKGNPNKRRDKKPGIRTDGTVILPDHLPSDAIACIEHIRSSMPTEVYCDLDSYALTCFAFAWSEHVAAVKGIQIDGHISVNQQGNEAPSAWHRIAREAAMVMAKYGPSLGLDPVSRQDMANRNDVQESKFGSLVGGRTG